MTTLVPRALAALLLTLALTACGGSTATTRLTPAATPTPVSSVAATVAFGATATTTTLPTLGIATTATFSVPAATGSGTLAVTASRAFPSDLSALQLIVRKPDRLQPQAASTYTTYFAIEFVPSAATTLSAVPSFTVRFDAGDVPSGTSLYVAYLTGNNGTPAWTTVAGPTTYTGGIFTFTGAATAQALNAGQRYGLVVYSVASGSPVGTPSASPSPGASSTPTASPNATSSPGTTNPATIAAYVLGTDANANSVLRVILPGAADYGRSVTLPTGWSYNALDTDAAGDAFIAGFATVSGGHTGTRIDRIASGTTVSAASIALSNGNANVVAAAPDGTVYFDSLTTMSYAAPNSTVVVNPISAGSAAVTALRTDSNGNVYSAQQTGSTFALVVYAPRLASILRTIPLQVPTTFSSVRHIGIASDGTAYVAISSGAANTPNLIAVIAPGGTTAANTTLTTGAASDFGFDAANNVYVAIASTNNSTDGVSVYTPNLASKTRSFVKPQSDGGQPGGIRVDPQGAIYLISGPGFSSGFLYIYAPGASTASVRTATGITLPAVVALGS